MPYRQIFIVLLSLIAIVGAALFVLSWGDDGDTADPASTTTLDPAATTTVPAPATSAVVAVTTSIPVDCGTDDPPETTTTVADTTTSIDTTTTEAELLVPTLGPNSSLSTVGLDRVTFGLTLSQARTEAGTEFDACGPVGDCYRVTPRLAPEGINFVVHDGTNERVDIVGDSPIETVSGAGIDTTDAELDELFGDLLERVELGGGTVDVVFVPESENDADFRVVFTTVDGVVESMRAGRLPLVLESDPCA